MRLQKVKSREKRGAIKNNLTSSRYRRLTTCASLTFSPEGERKAIHFFLGSASPFCEALHSRCSMMGKVNSVDVEQTELSLKKGEIFLLS